MNFSKETLEQTERYLEGNMTAEELKVYEKELENNQDLLDYIRLNKQMCLQYSEDDWDFAKNVKRNDKLDALENLFASEATEKTKRAINKASTSYFKENPNNKKKKNNYKLYFTLTIAACITLLVGFFFKDNKQTNDIYLSYSSWEELPSLIERGDLHNTLIYDGEKAFQDKNYKVARDAFAKVLVESKVFDTNVLLYLGISQLELGEYETALSSFNKVIESNSLDRSKGYWYSGLLYLKRGDKAKAIKVFETISVNVAYYNNNKAKVILEQLKDN